MLFGASVPPPRHRLKMLIGLKGADDIWVSIFGGVRHPEVREEPANGSNRDQLPLGLKTP